MLEYDIVKTVLTNAYRWQDVAFLKELQKYGSQIGCMYYNAIITDNVDIVHKLEEYGFPDVNEYADSADLFVRRILPEAERFNAKNILEYFETIKA